MRAEARARGITILGFGLQVIAGLAPTFFGLTIVGFVLGDEDLSSCRRL